MRELMIRALGALLNRLVDKPPSAQPVQPYKAILRPNTKDEWFIPDDPGVKHS